MTKVSKASVNYREARGTRRCGNCSMYKAKTCTLVAGVISPGDVCDRWAKRSQGGTGR